MNRHTHIHTHAHRHEEIYETTRFRMRTSTADLRIFRKPNTVSYRPIAPSTDTTEFHFTVILHPKFKTL